MVGISFVCFFYYRKSGYDEVRTVVASTVCWTWCCEHKYLVDARRRLVTRGAWPLTPFQSADARLRRDMGGRNPDVPERVRRTGSGAGFGAGDLNVIGNNCP
jgi:hypothetical protein